MSFHYTSTLSVVIMSLYTFVFYEYIVRELCEILQLTEGTVRIKCKIFNFTNIVGRDLCEQILHEGTR